MSNVVRLGYIGVAGLDDLTPDGITYDTQVMAEGDTGIGKSVLAAQFLYEGLVTGDTCVYIACDEPPQMMRENMANFRLGTAAYERAGKLIFVDAYSRERSRERYVIPEPTNFDEFYLYEKRFVEMAGDSPVRLVVDSFSTIVSLALTSEILAFNSSRLRYLRSRNVLTLDTVVRGVLDERALNGLRHSYPMILNMRYITNNGLVQRYIQLGKLKSGQFQASQLQYFVEMYRQAGYGDLSVVSFDPNKPEARLRGTNLFEAGLAEKTGVYRSPRTVDHYTRGMFAGFMSTLVGREFICEEMACEFRGDSTCEFVVLPREV